MQNFRCLKWGTFLVILAWIPSVYQYPWRFGYHLAKKMDLQEVNHQVWYQFGYQISSYGATTGVEVCLGGSESIIWSTYGQGIEITPGKNLVKHPSNLTTNFHQTNFYPIILVYLQFSQLILEILDIRRIVIVLRLVQQAKSRNSGSSRIFRWNIRGFHSLRKFFAAFHS